MIKITFPDNSVREYAKGTTAMQIAESISSRLAQEVLAASVNGEVWDLSRPINDDATVKLYHILFSKILYIQPTKLIFLFYQRNI